MARSPQAKECHFITILNPDLDSIFKILWTFRDFPDNYDIGTIHRPANPFGIESDAFKPKCNYDLATFVNTAHEDTYFQLDLIIYPKYPLGDFDYSIQLSYLDNQDRAADNIKPCHFLKPVILTTKMMNGNKNVISTLNEVIAPSISTQGLSFPYPVSGNVLGQFLSTQNLNDCLMVEFTMKSYPGDSILLQEPVIIDTKDDKRVKLHNHYVQSYLNENKMGTDLYLRTDDGDFYCHKDILAAVSPTFKNILTLPELKGFQFKVNAETAKHFLRYIYTGVIPRDVPLSSVVDLYQVAKTYQVKLLMTLCENEVFNRLKIETAVEVFNFANQLKDEGKKTMAARFIIDNFEEVKNTPAYRNIPQYLGVEFTRLYLLFNQNSV